MRNLVILRGLTLQSQDDTLFHGDYVSYKAVYLDVLSKLAYDHTHRRIEQNWTTACQTQRTLYMWRYNKMWNESRGLNLKINLSHLTSARTETKNYTIPTVGERKKKKKKNHAIRRRHVEGTKVRAVRQSPRALHPAKTHHFRLFEHQEKTRCRRLKLKTPLLRLRKETKWTAMHHLERKLAKDDQQKGKGSVTKERNNVGYR